MPAAGFLAFSRSTHSRWAVVTNFLKTLIASTRASMWSLRMVVFTACGRVGGWVWLGESGVVWEQWRMGHAGADCPGEGRAATRGGGVHTPTPQALASEPRSHESRTW